MLKPIVQNYVCSVMQHPSFHVYLDSHHVGHAFLELRHPNRQKCSVYGFYPEAADDKKEVLFGKGEVRDDRQRLTDSLEDEDVNLIEKSMEINEQEFRRAKEFVDEELKSPEFYFLGGYNCVDFIQDTFRKLKDDKTANFVSLYSKAELGKLAEVGSYAKFRYGI